MECHGRGFLLQCNLGTTRSLGQHRRTWHSVRFLKGPCFLTLITRSIRSNLREPEPAFTSIPEVHGLSGSRRARLVRFKTLGSHANKVLFVEFQVYHVQELGCLGASAEGVMASDVTRPLGRLMFTASGFLDHLRSPGPFALTPKWEFSETYHNAFISRLKAKSGPILQVPRKKARSRTSADWEIKRVPRFQGTRESKDLLQKSLRRTPEKVRQKAER